MSQARPMDCERRLHIYLYHRKGGELSPKQARRHQRKERLEAARAIGEMKPHGATGVPVRHLIVRPSKGPERGSIVTHVVYYCDPCPKHLRPRLHRRPIEATL